jgi:nucleotide-binding universal stress UspA family protein
MIKLQRVLFPTDFSESARHAFAYALAFVQEFGAELYLLHVIEVLPTGYAGDLFPSVMGQVVSEIHGYAKDELAKLATEARAREIRIHERIAQGKAAAEIIRVAREDQIDMIVIGTHGRGALSHALFGSTTDRVVRKAPCPVLICRQAEHELVTK